MQRVRRSFASGARALARAACAACVTSPFVALPNACAKHVATEAAPAPSASSEPSASAASLGVPAPSASANDAAAPTASAAPGAAPRDGNTPLMATRQLASFIFEKPQRDSAHVGVLRVGARVARSAEPVSVFGCNGPSAKWYSVEPRGFMCAGFEGVTTNVDDPAVVLASQYPPKTGEPFPYAYGTSFGTPLYVRTPTPREQKKLEGNVEEHIAAMERLRTKLSPQKQWPVMAMETSELPALLADHGQSPAILEKSDTKLATGAVVAGRGWPDMRLSLLAAYDVEGRSFYLTSEHFLVPFDRIRPAKLAEFHGVVLAPADAPPEVAGEHLPLAWVNWKPAPLYVYDETKRMARPTSELLEYQAHVAVKESVISLGGVKFHELASPPPNASEQGARYLVRDGTALRMDAAKQLPFGVGPEDAWIDISIAAQTLVLYKGLVPVFGTLVSTGVDGAGDPEKTKSTPRGLYRIRAKHVTARMAGDERAPAKEGDKPDARYRVDDVPYVQYFHAGYAIHGAYWHDAFGQPRSHGCVNVSPRDALYLFQQTTPTIPAGWHGAYGGIAGAEQGTWVRIRAY